MPRAQTAYPIQNNKLIQIVTLVVYGYKQTNITIRLEMQQLQDYRFKANSFRNKTWYVSDSSSGWKGVWLHGDWQEPQPIRRERKKV